jgi:predicted RNA-binding Zn ribbon-like protein
VQLLLNSQDLEHEVDWLPDWLSERGLVRADRRARALRSALRALVRANNGVPLDDEAVATVNAAARRVSLQVDSTGAVIVTTDGDALDRVVAIALGAMLDGSWGRLKACRNCRWSFYDRSPNRSGTWCSMQLCGNRKKTRAYRRRKTASL